MLLSTLIFIIGSLLSSLSGSADQLLLARTLFGIAIGMASFITPDYISEIAPEKIRGSLMSLYLFIIAIGVIMAFLSNTFINSGWWHCSFVSTPWRLMLGIIILPAFITLIGILFLPESPRWLFLKGFTDKAVASLAKIGFSPEEILQAKKESATTFQKKEEGFVLLKKAPLFVAFFHWESVFRLSNKLLELISSYFTRLVFLKWQASLALRNNSGERSLLELLICSRL